MNINTKLIGLTLLLVALQAPAQQQDSATVESARKQRAAQERTEREDMQREVEEAARAIGAYSAGRRDQALARSREALDAMDRRIQRMNDELSREAQRQHAQAQAERDRQAADVRARRAKLERQYREMEASNANFWAQTRDAFVRAYRELAARLRGRQDPADGQQKAPAQEKDAPAEEGD